MKRFLGIGIVLLLCFFSLIVFASQKEATTDKKEGKIAVEELLRHLDLGKYTKAQIEEYVKEADGKTFYGKGEVFNVQSGRKGNFKVLIMVKGNVPPAHRGYNVVLLTENPDTIKLNKGEKIKFEGTFEKRRFAFFGTTARQKVGVSVDIKGDYKIVK